MSSDVRPSTISSEISSPVTGACITPCPENPAALMKPSTPSTLPRIGCLSGVSSYSPAHPVLMDVRSRIGNRESARSTTAGMKSQLTLSSNAGFSFGSAIPSRTPPDSRCAYSPVANSMVSGKSSSSPGTASVTKMCRRSGGIHDGARSDLLVFRAHTPYPAVGAGHCRDAGVLHEGDARFAGARHVAVQHAGRIGVTVLRAERTETHIVGACVFEERLGVGRGHLPCGHAEARPHGERALERVDIAVLADEEEVADLMEMRIGPDLVRESLDVRKR